jgi:hypothetical protein
LGGAVPVALGVPTTAPDESVAGFGAPAGVSWELFAPDTPLLAKFVPVAVPAPPVLTLGVDLAEEFF